ncbi:MAG: macrolide family glycosyltransferase [Methylococcales bacterium]
MTTGYVFAHPCHGHINPLLPIVAELVQRGEHLVFYASDEFRSDIEATGAEYRAYPGDTIVFTREDIQINQKYVWLLNHMYKLLLFAEKQIPALLHEIKKSEPQYIIYDSLAPWGKIIAQITKLPHISSCAVYYIGMENCRTMLPKLEIATEILHYFPALFRNRINYLMTRYRIQKRWNVKVPYLIGFFANKGDCTLIYSSRSFQEGSENLDKTCKFIGHSIKTETIESSVPADLKSDSPLILVSLGTVFNDKPDFFRLCSVAFQDTPYHVILNTGCDVCVDFINTLPSNVQVFKWLDFSKRIAVLKQASLFVTHSGANSIKESFLAGKPMLLTPLMGDQFYMAKRTEKLGAGLRFNWETITPGELRKLAEKVINDPSYKTNSLRIGDSLREAGGAIKGAD